MREENFADATLVLIGHGSSTNAPASSASVYQHAAELRRRGLFAEVRESFWKQEPRVIELVPRLQTPRIFLAPLFISEGYFGERVIPNALGFAFQPGGAQGRLLRRNHQALIYCRPVGTHSSLTALILAGARTVIEQFPFPHAPAPLETSFFIAGHGTEQEEASRQSIDTQVQRIAALSQYAGVHGIFLEEDPRVSACYGLAGTKYLVVVPFFMSDGAHVRVDIPIQLGEPERLVRQRLEQGRPTWRNPTEKQGKLVWYAPSVGTTPRLADVILERVREAAGFSG